MEKTIHAGTLSSIRKEFFALRNGMIADTLRKGGLEQKYIFGLQLPQIKETALRHMPSDQEEAYLLAKDLWRDKECRESRLLACHMMPPSKMTFEEAKAWGEDAATREEADILAFRLLRYLPYAEDLACTLADSDDTLKKYTASAIQRFI